VDPKTSRPSFLSLALGAPIAGAALAACGSSGPSGAGGSSSDSGGGGGGGSGSASYWFLSGQPQQAVREDTVKRFTSSGGGGLKEYVKAGQVLDMTDWFKSNPDQQTRRFPSSFQAATIKNKIYALPAETVTPIVFYYSKKVFEKAGVSEPATIGK